MKSANTRRSAHAADVQPHDRRASRHGRPGCETSLATSPRRRCRLPSAGDDRLWSSRQGLHRSRPRPTEHPIGVVASFLIDEGIDAERVAHRDRVRSTPAEAAWIAEHEGRHRRRSRIDERDPRPDRFVARRGVFEASSMAASSPSTIRRPVIPKRRPSVNRFVGEAVLRPAVQVDQEQLAPSVVRRTEALDPTSCVPDGRRALRLP